MRQRLLVVSAGFLAAVVAIAVGVPLVVTIDPYQQNLRDALVPPGGAGHLLVPTSSVATCCCGWLMARGCRSRWG